MGSLLHGRGMVLGLLAVTALLVLPWVARAQGATPEVLTIRGIVEVAEEDDDGNVLEIGIWDEALREYFIIDEKAEKGPELRALLGKMVELSARVVTNPDGTRRIVVAAITVLPDPPAEEDEGSPFDEGGDEGSDEGSDEGGDASPDDGGDGDAE